MDGPESSIGERDTCVTLSLYHAGGADAYHNNWRENYKTYADLRKADSEAAWLRAFSLLDEEKQLGVSLYKFEDDYCDQFYTDTMMAQMVGAYWINAIKQMANVVRKAKSREFYLGWLDSLCDGQSGVGADEYSYNALGYVLMLSDSFDESTNGKRLVIETLIDLGCSIRTSICHSDFERPTSLFKVSHESDDKHTFEDIVRGLRQCRQAVYLLLVSRWPSRDVAMMIARSYVWPLRYDIEWQVDRKQKKIELVKEAKEQQKAAKAAERARKKAECDEMKCQHKINLH